VDNEVKVVDDLSFEAPRTGDLRTVLDAVGVDRTCLIALHPGNRNAALSARNLPEVTTVRIMQLNAFELLNHRYLVVDKASLESFLDGSAWAGDDAKGDR
jgi:large subunit ribosomal protein L4